jgi:uncharacterized protein (DUF1778 family)
MTALAKDTRLHIRCDQEVRRLLDKAAAYARMSVSEFVLRHAVERPDVVAGFYTLRAASVTQSRCFLPALRLHRNPRSARALGVAITPTATHSFPPCPHWAHRTVFSKKGLSLERSWLAAPSASIGCRRQPVYCRVFLCCGGRLWSSGRRVRAVGNACVVHGLHPLRRRAHRPLVHQPAGRKASGPPSASPNDPRAPSRSGQHLPKQR